MSRNHTSAMLIRLPHRKGALFPSRFAERFQFIGKRRRSGQLSTLPICLAGVVRVLSSIVGNGHCSFWKLLLLTKTRVLVNIRTSATVLMNYASRSNSTIDADR